jgi:RNA polymerase sigma-70 factor (ECF subfamily)
MSSPFKAELVALIPKLRAYALVLTRSSSDADDLVQEALLRAWKYQASYGEGTSLKAWVFRILRNEFLTRSKAERHVQDTDGKLAAQLVTNPDQEFVVRYGELIEGLRQLSDATREALLLTAGAGLTYGEAAELCDCPVGTIKSRVNRAREILAEHFEAGGPASRRAPAH